MQMLKKYDFIHAIYRNGVIQAQKQNSTLKNYFVCKDKRLKKTMAYFLFIKGSNVKALR